MRIVRSIQVNEDSVDLAYMDDQDVRCEGFVFQTHHISIGRGGNWDTEIDKLEGVVEALLTDVLVDFTASPAHDTAQDLPTYEEEDDDDDEEE